MTPKVHKTPSTATELATLFARTGYVRRCDAKRRAREGQSYKKGYEVRFVLGSEHETRAVRHLLRAAGLRPGKPFRKHNRLIQPVYGRAAVDWFLAGLPSGRERLAVGFAADGRRVGRRPRGRAVAREEDLPITGMQPAGGASIARLKKVRSRAARGSARSR